MTHLGHHTPLSRSETRLEQYGYAQYVREDKGWFKNRRIMLLNLWICLILITSSTSGDGGTLIDGFQGVHTWEEFFRYPATGRLGIFNAIQTIGSLVAYPISPYVTDGLGRRVGILIGAVIMVLAVIVQTASQSEAMFIGARFFLGFGLTFGVSAAPLLISEIAYPTQRAQLVSIYDSLWHLGGIMAAWSTYGTFRMNTDWAWRIPSALQGLPSIIQVALIWFVPESPRWLVGKGRETEALATLAYYHADGNENDPLVCYEFEEMKRTIAIDRENSAGVGWLTLLATPGNRKRMRIIIALAFFTQWSGNALATYYLNEVLVHVGITSSNTQLLLNGILSVFSCIVAVFAGLFCEKLGRRFLFLAGGIGLTITWSLQTVCFAVYEESHNVQAGRAAVAMIFCFTFCYNLAFQPLVIAYVVEILPFSLRAKGFTVFNFTLGVCLIFNQYINPIALKSWSWKYFIVFAVWDLVETIFCYFYIIETKNRSLEETAALFDGDDAADLLVAHGEYRAMLATHRLEKKSTRESRRSRS